MKLANFAAGALIAALSVAIVSPAKAQLIGSNAQIAAENGFGSGNTICKDAFKLTTINGGGELLGSDWSGGCIGLYTVDVTNNLLTMTAVEYGNYSYAHFNLQLLGGPTFTSFSFLGYNGLFLDPNRPMNQSNFVPVTTFGGNFVDVLWDTGSDNNQFAFSTQVGDIGTAAELGTATFAFTTQDVSVTPEPATVALLAPGLAAMAGMARRRKRKAA